MLAAAADDSLFDSDTWDVAKNLGIFLAVDLIFSGVGWISMGLGLKPRP